MHKIIEIIINILKRYICKNEFFYFYKKEKVLQHFYISKNNKKNNNKNHFFGNFLEDFLLK